jgi:hypothetical protein
MDEIAQAHAAYQHRLTNAWRDGNHGDDDGDDDDIARLAAIRKALIARGADPDAADDYLADLDDDDLYADHDTHLKTFAGDHGRQTDAATLARDHKAKMDELYRQRDAELANQWRKNK